MSEREYIVSLHKNVDCAAFNREMIAHSGSGTIPCRCVYVANARHGSQRNTHYMLTDAEAETLRLDPRVYGVEIPPDQRTDIVIGLSAVQTGDFSKTTATEGAFVNWGLRRLNETRNPYIDNTVVGGYNYTLDGTGVDIVIHDTGIQADHPEFEDSQGNSRVRQINWYAASGLPGTMPSGHYTDFHGHGTHVGATAAGKVYGFAKNARIYAVKVAGLEGPLDPNPGIPITDCFDIIKQWHANKPIDPSTGVKRPTIVNMSWGYFQSWATVSQINYRGVTYSGAAIDTAGEIANFGFIPVSNGTTYIAPVRVLSVDVDLEELIDAGVHVTISSGNNFHKIDVVGGVDYNNAATTNNGTIYYHRGSSPYSTDAHIVGNIDSAVHTGGLEQKAQSSCTGPGVSIYAPGTNIMSAASNINVFDSNGLYPADTDFKIANISGTSMAAPQIAGVLALYTQLNPDVTPLQAKTFLNNSAQSNQIFETGLSDDYANFRSLLGGSNKFAYNKFNSAVQLTLGSQVQQIIAQNLPTYALSTSNLSVNEGSSFTITLTTTNVDNGTAVPYTITGVSSGDIGGISLSGNFTVNTNTASLTINVTSDLTTEDSEIFTLTLDSLNISQNVTINDTSTAPILVPTYEVTPATSSVNEGSALTINVATTNVNNGTTLYWTVSNASDFNISSGSFIINSNAGMFTVTPSADITTEGTETFTVSIRTGGVSGTVVATSSTITINDTSTTPVVLIPTYEVTPATSSVNEGSALTINVVTTNIDNGTTLYWTVSNIEEFDISSGSFIINSNAGMFTVTPSADITTEGTETFTVSIRTGGIDGIVVATSSTITINDTSTTPEVIPGFELFSTPGSTTFTVPSGVTSVNVVAIGGGGGGQMSRGTISGGERSSSGGGGGGLGWKNNISVTPGQSYTVVVGAGGAGGTIVGDQVSTSVDGSNGLTSYFISSGTVAGFGGGGGRSSGDTIGAGGSFTGDGGGAGGQGNPRTSLWDGGGGGGAGGYSGNGGIASFGTGSDPSTGSGGGGGGASRENNNTTQFTSIGGQGGGTGVHGIGTDGTGGGSGQNGGSITAPNGTGGSNGNYGGGGGGAMWSYFDAGATRSASNGSNGAVLIRWGTGTLFPDYKDPTTY